MILRVLFLLISFFVSIQAFALDTFPGCEGHGCNATCGAGATRGDTQYIYWVNSLSCAQTGSCQVNNASSDCALADCLAGGEAGRTCVFMTSGVIDCSSESPGTMTIGNPYLTVAGYTAPSPGVLLRNRTISIQASEVCIQGMWLEGGQNPNKDGISIIGFNGNTVENVVISNNTIRFSTDGAFDIRNLATNGSDTVKNISIYRNFMYQGIDDYTGTTSTSKFSFAMLIAGVKNSATTPKIENISILQNAICHFDERLPKLAGAMDVEFVNNYLCNGKRQFINIDNSSYEGMGESALSIFGNYAQIGVDSTASHYILKNPNSIDNETRIYPGVANQDGNIGPQRTSDASDEWAFVDTLSSSPYETATRQASSGYTALAASAVKSTVLTNAGAWAYQRDSVDDGFISDANGSLAYTIPSCVTGCGDEAVSSLIALDENYSERNELIPQNRSFIEASGYTSLEEWLHAYKAIIDGTATQEPDGPDPVTLRGGNQNNRLAKGRFAR